MFAVFVKKHTKNVFLSNRLDWSGCGAVGRAVASNIRGPRFESSHWQLLLNIYLLLTVCRKDENKEKRPGMAHFFKKKSSVVFPFNNSSTLLGSGCGTGWQRGRFRRQRSAVRIQSLANFLSDIYLFTVNCIEKTKIKIWRLGIAHI